MRHSVTRSAATAARVGEPLGGDGHLLGSVDVERWVQDGAPVGRHDRAVAPRARDCLSRVLAMSPRGRRCWVAAPAAEVGRVGARGAVGATVAVTIVVAALTVPEGGCGGQTTREVQLDLAALGPVEDVIDGQDVGRLLVARRAVELRVDQGVRHVRGVRGEARCVVAEEPARGRARVIGSAAVTEGALGSPVARVAAIAADVDATARQVIAVARAAIFRLPIQRGAVVSRSAKFWGW